MPSAIEWLQGGETWNPIRARNRETGKVGWFCTKPSPGCAGCYAERMNVHGGNNPGRMGNGIRYAVDKLGLVDIYLDVHTLTAPLRWKKPRLIFPCSMTDWMADFVPDDWIEKMMAVMALTPQHTYLTLTKRADRQRQFFQTNSTGGRIFHVAGQMGNPQSGSWPLPNHWMGVSTENQEWADKRIPDLLQTPAAIRWISAEPLLGPIDLMKQNYLQLIAQPGWQGEKRYPFPELEEQHRTKLLHMIDWVVAGGESGPKARPMDQEWTRSLRDQCVAAGVPFFFKQWGEYRPSPDSPNVWMKMGKKSAGRLLDGKEWNQYPERK